MKFQIALHAFIQPQISLVANELERHVCDVLQDVLTAFDFLPDESPDTSQVIDLDIMSSNSGQIKHSNRRQTPPPPIPPKPDRMRHYQVPEPQEM